MARKSLGVTREGLIRVWQSLWKLPWLEQVTDGTLSTRWYLREGGRGRGRVQACKERDNTAPEDPRASVRSTTDYRCSLNTQLRNVSPMYSTLKSLCVCLSDCSSAYLGAELV